MKLVKLWFINIAMELVDPKEHWKPTIFRSMIYLSNRALTVAGLSGFTHKHICPLKCIAIPFLANQNCLEPRAHLGMSDRAVLTPTSKLKT